GADAGPAATRRARPRRGRRPDGLASVRTSDRAGRPERGCVDGEGCLPSAARTVPGGARRIRSSPLPPTRSRARDEVAGDLPQAPGVGGIGVTLPPETAGRFLPSVDRLENTLRAARRAFDRGDLKGALREDDVAI